MITAEERAEIIRIGQADGQRLFTVAEAIYKWLIILNWITAVVGGLLGAYFLISSITVSYGGGGMALMGILVLVGTAIACAVGYAAAVLATHGAKVLVHLLFSNLAIMEKGDA